MEKKKKRRIDEPLIVLITASFIVIIYHLGRCETSTDRINVFFGVCLILMMILILFKADKK